MRVRIRRRPDLMKTPKGLQPLIDDGMIDEVVRPLKSGKEASVYVVRCGAEVRCAKVYKDMAQRSFQARVLRKEEGAARIYSGSIRLEVHKRGNQPLIRGIFHKAG